MGQPFVYENALRLLQPIPDGITQEKTKSYDTANRRE